MNVILVGDLPPQRYSYNHVPLTMLSAATALVNIGKRAIVVPWNEAGQCDPLVVEATIQQYTGAIMLSKAHKFVVLCGDYISCEPRESMKSPVFSYGVVGDPERPLAELFSGEKPEKIAGLVYRKDSRIICNPALDLCGSELPKLDYDLWQGCLTEPVNISRGRFRTVRDGMWHHRGHLGRKHYISFRAELRQLAERGIEEVIVEDDDFCGGLPKVKTTIQDLDRFRAWSMRVSTQTFSKSELKRMLIGSNCSGITLVLPVASDRLAYEYKLPRFEEGANVAKDIQNLGIDVTMEVVIGFPGETVCSLREAEQNLKDYKTRVVTFIPVPGTLAYRHMDFYGRFGFEVTGTQPMDFCIDDDAPCHDVPWRSSVISANDFVTIRNELIGRFNGKQRS
jgi:radical SAM superfamily enzyme YgiQ (UPF0313 family)